VVEFWSKLVGKRTRPTREEVEAVLTRERAEAVRQRLERAMQERSEHIVTLVGGILPERKSE